MISSIPAGISKTFVCNGMEGRYVNIVIPGRKEYLTLCEVEVHGEPSDTIIPTGEFYHIKCFVDDFEQIITEKVKSNMLTACFLLSLM